MIASFSWEDWERIARIGNAASRDDARPILTGIQLEDDGEKVSATATDSYKLATVAIRTDAEDGTPVLIPAGQVRTATTAFRQLAGAQLGSKWATLLNPEEPPITLTQYDERHVRIEFSMGARFIGLLAVDVIDGRFPAYRALLHRPGAELSRSQLARKRKDEIAAYISVQYGRRYDDETNSKRSLLDIAEKFAGEPTTRTIGLSPEHLTALMRTTRLEHAPLRIEMFGEARPIFFSNPADKAWLGIQMPVRTV